MDREGQKQERTEWHRIVVWGKLAEVCRQHLSKGRQVYVEGRLQTRSWEDQQGQKRYITEINANGGEPDAETTDYLQRNADYVKKTNTEANLCLLGFVGLWGVSVVDAVWDPFGSRKAIAKKTAEVEEEEDDSAGQWAKQEELDRLTNKGRFSAFAVPKAESAQTGFGISFEKKFR